MYFLSMIFIDFLFFFLINGSVSERRHYLFDLMASKSSSVKPPQLHAHSAGTGVSKSSMAPQDGKSGLMLQLSGCRTRFTKLRINGDKASLEKLIADVAHLRSRCTVDSIKCAREASRLQVQMEADLLHRVVVQPACSAERRLDFS